MKVSSLFVCQNCGFETPKWAGRCPSCGTWNSLVETSTSFKSLKTKNQKVKKNLIKPLRLSEIESLKFARIKTDILELDRVLGGGIVPGSVVLVAGEPGMGKSTLLTQLALKVANLPRHKAETFQKVFYICGEESPAQVKLRLERLVDKGNKPPQDLEEPKIAQKQNLKTKKSHSLNFFLLPETNVENIIKSLVSYQPQLVIVDSIQTLWTETLSGMSGSVGQIRESANFLTDFAKNYQIPVFLVGHVTKEGMIAGPKILEHLVDTVLYLEGDKNHEFRILRAVKNRFGPTDEVGIFMMTDKGMEEVENPAEAFIEKSKIIKAGSCTVVAMQGLRPVLVEIQALCIKSQLPVPRRLSRGIDNNRLQILCAVLEKRANISLYNQDIFLSIVGGLRLNEPAVDFGICLAIASSYKNKTLTEKSVAIGEVGLLGEIRKVSFWEKRVKQAKALGYHKILGPDTYVTVEQAIRKLLK